MTRNFLLKCSLYFCDSVINKTEIVEPNKTTANETPATQVDIFK